MTTNQIMAQAIDYFGAPGQTVKAIEEMAELQKELCKYLNEEEIRPERLDAISQEMADVEIMLEQLKTIFANRERVEEWKKLKLLRLEYRLKQKGAQA